MQGIWINGNRPKSKKEVKENIAVASLEATSIFGDEYNGLVANAPDGTYTFVGPDPYRNRKFYGTIVKSGSKVVVK